MSRFASRWLRVSAAALVSAGLLADLASARVAAATETGSLGPAGSVSMAGALFGVAATSATNAWAVGSAGEYPGETTLVVHWDGTAWTRVPSPSPAGGQLSGVAATSATNAWAVGAVNSSTGSRTLILHWDGASWKQVPSPSPTRYASLSAVAAISASDAWAVGTVVLHWDGTVWQQVPRPGDGTLFGVTATSAKSAWAVGVDGNKSLVLHWDGATWARRPSPSPDANEGLADILDSVTVTSAGSAWAVGDISCGCGPGASLIERWDGKMWTRVPSPLGGGGAVLRDAVAISGRNAWVVGDTGSGDGPTKTLTMWWDGNLWRQVPSPSPGANAALSGLAVTSANNAWAVGTTSGRNRNNNKTLILRWTGAVWEVSSSPTSTSTPRTPTAEAIAGRLACAAGDIPVGTTDADGFHCAVIFFRRSAVDADYAVVDLRLEDVEGRPESNGSGALVDLATGSVVVGPSGDLGVCQFGYVPPPQVPPAVLASLGLPTSCPTTAPPPATAGAGTERSEALAVNALLAQSTNDRNQVRSAISALTSCTEVATGAAALQSVATSRRSLLDRLHDLGLGQLPNGPRLQSVLAAALSESVQADQDFAAWARGLVSDGCRPASATNNPDYQAAAGPDNAAESDKAVFARLWAPVARQFDLPAQSDNSF